MKNFHVGIIGSGVIGSSIAWELSKYELDIAIFEMGSDVSSGASKANSGVVHSGINSPPSSLKVQHCIKGNAMFKTLSNQLGFPLKWIGKYVIAKNKDEVEAIENLKKIGEKNNISDLEIKKGSDVRKYEPNINCYKALWVPTAGITNPYGFNITLAENAAINNATFFLETKVIGLKKEKDYFLIKTNKKDFKSEIIVNAAGLNCREIVSMIEKPDFQIFPCRGEYLVLDKNYRNLINSMIYPIPLNKSGVLGVHITPTIEGNILIGPTAEFIKKIDDKKTTNEMMKTIIKEAREIIPSISYNAVISAYSGIRCKLTPPESKHFTDFIISQSRRFPGFINLLGIESPGLTASPSIAKDVTSIISKIVKLKKKQNFRIIKNIRKRFNDMSFIEKSNMIKKDKKWGKIVCRCENITEAEVIKSLSNPLGAQTLSSVKYRCRAGMGRCQGGFCTQHIVRIMEENFNIDINKMNLKSPNSNLFFGRTREK